MTDQWDHFDDHWAFDENWRKWIDDPPVGWRPPEKVPLFWRVVDRTHLDGWAVRMDAWLGAEGLHFHFRWVILLHIPDKTTLDAWITAGRPEDSVPEPTWSLTRKGVAGFVVRWMDLVLMEDLFLDPDQEGDNGKGGEIRPFERDE